MTIHLKSCRIFPLKVPATLLSVQGRAQLEHSSHIVKFGAEATCWNFKPWRILKVKTEPVGPFGTMVQEPWHSEKGAKLDRVIQLNCWEVRTHASYKIARTWETFNKRGTKKILLSDELWLITKVWVSVLKLNLFKTLKNFVMDLTV